MVNRPLGFRMSDAVAAFVRTLHPQIKGKVRGALQAIQANPAVGKNIRDELAGLWSFRVGRFRIVYRVVPGDYIDIVAIGPRRYIYEETYRIITKEEQDC